MPRKAGAPESTSKNESSKKKETPSVDLQKFLKDVEKRAYEIYLDRQKSGKSGDEFSDWVQAENDIKKKFKI
jgi:hypothetical protein